MYPEELLAWTREQLEIAADAEAASVSDPRLSSESRQQAHNLEAVYRAAARVKLYEAMDHPIAKTMLPQARLELQAALNGGNAAWQTTMENSARYNNLPPIGVRRGGYVSRHSKFHMVGVMS